MDGEGGARSIHPAPPGGWVVVGGGLANRPRDAKTQHQKQAYAHTPSVMEPDGAMCQHVTDTIAKLLALCFVSVKEYMH